MGDALAIAGERHRLDHEVRLFQDLARDRFAQRLADLDHAAGQRVDAVRRRPRAARDQHAAVAHDRGTDRENRPRWISP